MKYEVNGSWNASRSAERAHALVAVGCRVWLLAYGRHAARASEEDAVQALVESNGRSARDGARLRSAVAVVALVANSAVLVFAAARRSSARIRRCGAVRYGNDLLRTYGPVGLSTYGAVAGSAIREDACIPRRAGVALARATRTRSSRRCGRAACPNEEDERNENRMAND